MRQIKNMALTLLMAFAFLHTVPAEAQDAQKDQENAAKELLQAIDSKIESLADNLELEDWQIFYVDSILVHDYTAIQDGFKALQLQKISNSDIYTALQYEWMDKIYYALQNVFTEEQWAKYLKSGAAKDKKMREKFQAKRNSK